MGDRIYESAGVYAFRRDRRKIDGNTWEFTCEGAGNDSYRAEPHRPVTYIGRAIDTGCPVCEAIRARREAEAKLTAVVVKVKAFVDVASLLDPKEA